MLGFWCICVVLGLAIPMSALPQGSDIRGVKQKEALPSTTTEPTEHLSYHGLPFRLEDFLYETIIKGRGDKESTLLRTWRVNKKALLPILIGMGIKALAIIPLVLTGLSIMGSIAILVSKTSLAISAIMFLRRFFSHDSAQGGFHGLNPFNYGSSQEQHSHGYAPGNRRYGFYHRGRSEPIYSRRMNKLLKQLEDAALIYEDTPIENGIVNDTAHLDQNKESETVQ